MKDIQIVDIDYSSVNPKFKCKEKVEIDKIPAPWVIPEEGPFYEDTVRLRNGGTYLNPGSDYFFVEPATDLAEMTGKGVSLYIELKPHILTTVTVLDLEYQKVGNPVISRAQLIKALEDMTINGSDIDFENQITNKPLTYYPAKHSMDVSKKEEMVGFGNMVMLFNIMAGRIKTEGSYTLKLLEKLEKDNFDKLDYIQGLQWAAIMAHIRNYNNPHGVVAADVELGNHPNFQTASPQQDSEGIRNDLLSTPAGLARVLQEAEPDSEEYIFQNELPLSYYGSGIYLPPPITGSFEGLGGDVENSVFVREGNGWIVGLIRQFDGRVKQLNYVYQELMLDRYNKSQPVYTYLPYKHPDFDAKGIRPEYVINGSGKDLLAIGQWERSDRLMVSPSNGTLDPNSHSFTEIDSSVMWAGPDSKPTNGVAFGSTTIAKIGDWVYFIVTYSEQGSQAGQPHPTIYETENNVMRFFRFPWASLFAPGKPKITPVQINISYDNTDLVRKPAARNVELGQYVTAPNGGVQGYLVNFTNPATAAYSHRRRQIVVLENPNVKNQARIKIFCVVYWTYNRDGQVGGNWRWLILDYNFDATTNLMTMAPGWVKPLINDLDGTCLNLTVDQHRREFDQRPSPDASLNIYGMANAFMDMFAYPCASWIPGFGYMGYCSLSTGGAPYRFIYLQLNETGDPDNDYQAIFNPPLRFDPRGEQYGFVMDPPTPSPFGVANFPRMYSDIYEYNGKVNATPIEQFMAVQENLGQGYFNRMSEGGTDNNYALRPSFQSSFIPSPVYGRTPNSKFGRTTGFDQDRAFRNWPQRRDKYSTTHSVVTLHFRPKLGKSYSTSDILGPQLSTPNRLRLPLVYKWNYSETTKVLTPSFDPTQTLVMTNTQYFDKIKQLMGSHFADVLEMILLVDVFPLPGARSGSVAESTITCVYSRSQDPDIARAVCASFTWTLGDIDPITGYRLMDITWTNDMLKANGNNLIVPPYKQTPGQDNIFAISAFRIDAAGYWSIGIDLGGSLTVRRNRSEVYSFGPTANDLVTVTQSSVFIATVGNMISFRVFHDRRIWADHPNIQVNSVNVTTSYPECFVAIDGKGIMQGYSPTNSGGAMSLVGTGYAQQIAPGSGFTGGELCLQGATFVEGNWNFFINADVTVTFNGYSMKAYKRAFDLRDYTDLYRSQKFYLYVVAKGSAAEYELDNVLRYPNGDQLLVAIITTSDLGIVTIERLQPFAISGYPLTRKRDAGIPVSSGSLVEEGTYKFIKASELYDN